MATRKPFGNRTSKEGVAANDAAAKKAVTPTPAKPTPTKPSTRSKPSNSTATPNKTPARSTTPPKVTAGGAIETAAGEQDPTNQRGKNVEMFMSIIGGMPPEAKNRYVSAFSDFLALPLDKQNEYIGALEQQAKDIVGPKIEQDRTRLKEDFQHELDIRDRQKRDLKATFDKVVADMDFNRNRDIAKENKTAAGVMQNIGNVAFVTGVAGGGIFRRRTALAREGLQDRVDDVNIDYSQQRGQIDLKKSQADSGIDSEIARLYQLNDRDVTDLDQRQLEDETAMFIELYGNKFGEKGEQNAQLIESGAGAAADFEAGGTDQERKGRHTEETDRKRLDAERAREDQAVSRYKELFDITRGLTALGRTAELGGIQAEMQRLRPTVESVLRQSGKGYVDGDYAKYGYAPRTFLGSTKNPDMRLEDIERGWSTEFNTSNDLLYRGMNDSARSKINKFLEDNLNTIKMYS